MIKLLCLNIFEVNPEPNFWFLSIVHFISEIADSLRVPNTDLIFDSKESPLKDTTYLGLISFDLGLYV